LIRGFSAATSNRAASRTAPDSPAGGAGIVSRGIRGALSGNGRHILSGGDDRLVKLWDTATGAELKTLKGHDHFVFGVAITRDGRAVAVKVQYPGIARTIEADLQNVTLLRRIAAVAFPGLDTRSLVDELRDRLREEVDYRLEAESQNVFANYYEAHPVIHVPRVVRELSSARVLTSELVAGARFDELLGWSQRERDLAAETIEHAVGCHREYGPSHHGPKRSRSLNCQLEG